MKNKDIELIVLTGISGAGKSSALNALEDVGYYAMDNIPPRLLSTFVELYLETEKTSSKIAVVIDMRTKDFLKDIFKELDRIRDLGIDYRLIFLDAKDEEIVKRYKEFRRPHPLSSDGNVLEGLMIERELLSKLKKESDYVIDTTNLSIHKLKSKLISIVDTESANKIRVSLVSFGFKNGILLDGDFIFDARFLPNPYYVEDLRELNGKDEKVKNYVFGSDLSNFYVEDIANLLKKIIPEYKKDGRYQLTVGIGCTGGKHRSVALTEKLKSLIESDDIEVSITHRDIGR